MTQMASTPPVVPGHPILGNLPALRSDRIGFLMRVAREQGDIARFRFGLIGRGVIVSASDLTRQVLAKNDDSFTKSFGLRVFARPILGNGLITSEGDFHKRQRRLSAPAFAHQRITSYVSAFTACTERAVARLAERSTVDLASELMQVTFEAVGKTLFDADVRGDATIVRDALTVAMENLNEQLGSVVPLPPGVPSPANLRARAAVRKINDIVYRLVRERRASGKDTGDFLSMLLAARDEDGSSMSDEQVRDEAMTILLVGHETTANALAWTFYLLAKHPDVRARLEDELDRVLGGRGPSLADLPNLTYTMQVFKEAMRLYPPVYMSVRRATRDVEIGSYQIKKNEMVMINIIGMHHREDYFRAAAKFDPSRFDAESEQAIDKFSYLPFGIGPRVCIGNHFALMEGQVTLAHLAQHFRFDLVGERAEVRPEPLITLRPKGGLPVHVVRRGHHMKKVGSASS